MANVLLIIDAVRGFCDIGNLRNPLMERIIPNIAELAEKKRQEGWRIIFLADNHEKNDKEFERFPEHCVIGTEETDIVPELAPFLEKDGGNYIPKNRHGGFFRTRLEAMLQKEAPEIIMVVGTCTDICVKYTVEELCNRDYRVIVIADCVATYHIDKIHIATEVDAYELRHMHDVLGAEIIPTQAEA